MPPSTTSPVQQVLLENLEWARQLAMGMARDSHLADDLVQEAFRIGLEKPPDKPSRARAWLAQVIRNNLRLHYRSGGRRRGREEKVAQHDMVEDHPLAPMEHRESMEAVSRTMLGLPEPFQSALLLHYWDGLTLAEIASRTAVPVRTVESRLRKGRELMKERLDREFNSEGAWAMAVMPLLLIPPTPKPLLKSAIASTACIAVLAGGFAVFGGSPSDSTASDRAVPVIVMQDNSDGVVSDPAEPMLLHREMMQTGDELTPLPAFVDPTLEVHLYDESTGASLENIEVSFVQYGDIETAHALGIEPLGYFFKRKYWAILASDTVVSNADGVATAEAIPGVLYIQVDNGLFSPEYSMLESENSLHRRITRNKEGWDRLELPLARRFGSAQGRIFSATDGEALVGAELLFWQGNFIKPPRPADFRMAANLNGNFQMMNIISQRRGCSLSASAPGWVSPFVYRAWPDFGPDFKGIHFPLVPAQQVVIQVIGSDGLPVEDAQVTVTQAHKAALPPSIEGGSFIHMTWPTQRSDAEGRAVFEALPDGLRVEVRASGYGFHAASIADGTAFFEVRLDQGMSVAGRVRDEQGEAVADAKVTLFCAEGELPIQTDAEGNFRFEHISRNQNMRLQFHKKNYAWWVSETLDGTTLSFQEIAATKAHTIMGRVTPFPDGVNLKSPPLHVSSMDLELSHGLSSAMWMPSFEAVVLADGRFVIKDLSAGDYLLRFTTPQGAVWTRRASAGDIDVVLGPDPDLHLQQIRGTIFRTGDASVVSFAQLQAFRIDTAIDPKTYREGATMTLMASSVAATANGSFELPALPPGKYSLCAWDPQSDRHSHHVLQLPEGGYDPIEIFLPENRGFDFVVRDAGGNPIAQARLRLVDADSVPHPLLQSSFPNRKMNVLTNESGEVRIENIPLNRGLILVVEASDESGLRIPVDEFAAESGKPCVIVLE